MYNVYGIYRNIYFYKDLKNQLWIVPEYNLSFEDHIKDNIDLLLDGFQIAA